MNTQSQFIGLGTALITPFKPGQNPPAIDWEAFGHLVEQQISGGVDFLVPCGTTGESPTLSHEEHNNVIKEAVRRVAGRVPVLAGTGSNSTEEALALTRAAKEVGANGALVVVPYYNKPTPAGLKAHFRAVAEVGLPVVLYDIPGRCGGQMAPAGVILQLAHEDAICGLKWASGNLDQLQDVLAGCPRGFTVLSGDDNLTFLAMCLGADGVISVLSNLATAAMVRFVNYLINRNYYLGRLEHFKLLPLMRAMFFETNPMPVKTALAMVWPEVFQEVFRSPLCEMTAANREKLRDVLRDYYDLLQENQGSKATALAQAC